MPELIIVCSAIISIIVYIAISKYEKTYINFYTPMMIFIFPIEYILELYYIYYFGYSNTSYGYFFCYLLYSLKAVFLLIIYLFFRKNVSFNKYYGIYKYNIRFSPYIFIGISFLLYLPILLEFKDIIFQPRQIYMATRLGYGLNYILSTTFFYIGFILLLVKEKTFTNKVWIFFVIGIIFIYFHASKLQYIVLIFIMIYYSVYVLNKRYSIIKTLKYILIMVIIILSLFYSNYKDYSDDIDVDNLIMNVALYSDYNRNCMKVIDTFPDILYGKLTFEDYVYSRIPRQIFTDKPKDYGARYLTLYYYPEWFYSEAGDPIFGYGMQYADFRELTIFYIFISSIIDGVSICLSIKYMGSKYTIVSLFTLLTSTGVPIIITGTGGLLIETILLGLIINKIALIKIK